MADIHGIHGVEDNSRGNEVANGGAPDPPAGYAFVTIANVSNRPVFLTTAAPDGARIRVIARKAGS